MGSIDAFSPAPSDGSVEVILLGTGTSSTIPHVDCLTAPPGAKKCRTCWSTLHPDGKKNIRRNTSAVLRVPKQDGDLATIVIDVGKSFQQAAVEWFPKYGLRKIDAVLITHAHADAMNGLDDLRGWTLHGAIQPYIDVYVSMDTYDEVKRAFPYLISKEFASGGGDVPEFNWHIIDDRAPFQLHDTGIWIHPFNVQHGFRFTDKSQSAFIPSPNSTNPPTPGVPGTPVRKGAQTPEAPPCDELELLTKPEPTPYYCFGFTVQNALTYISDTSHIPDEAWDYIRASHSGGRPPVLVLDCLRLEPHKSHLSLAQAVDVARRMGAPRTYLTGFSHEVSHEEYRTLLESVGGRVPPAKEMTEMVRQGLATLDDGEPIWVRPAYDGLRVFVSASGKEVWDTGYA
ncbi:beta-lactamase-like protein [Cubamyces menziesii]|nr:beta-lactamase-like protein [Cubamyces menziesii]